MDKNDLQHLIEQFMRITNNINEVSTHAIHLDDFPPLSLGEIHFIECIGKHPQSNVTEIATILGKTKGAVSQMAKKLEKKNLLYKVKKDNNQKEIVLELSDTGKEIFEKHELFHYDLYQDILSSIRDYSKEDLERITSVFTVIENHTNSYLKKYR